MVKTVGGSDVPDDALAKIAKCLDSRIDVLRIRSVCRSWRSSLHRCMDMKTLTPPHMLLKLPGPCSRRIKRSNIQIDRKLSQTTVYRIQPKGERECPNSAQVWFLKVEELEPNQMRILNPLSYFRGKCLPDSFPKVLNLLDYSITQISKGYAIKDLFKFPCGTSSLEVSTFSHKAVLYPDSIWTPLEDLTIFMLRQKGNLYYCKHGDEKWSRINDKEEKLSDIVVYRDKLYVVNRGGEVWTIDSSMKMIKHTPSPYDGGRGSMKHLVKSNGQLHLLDRHVICSGLSESDGYVEDTLDEERGSSEYDDDVEEGKDNKDNATQSYEDDKDEMDKHEDDENYTNGEVEEVKAKNEWDEHDEEGEEGDDEKEEQDEHEEGEHEKEEEEKEDLKNKWVGIEEHDKGEKKRSHQDKSDGQEKGDDNNAGENGMKDEPIIVSRYERCCFRWRNVIGLDVYNLDEDLGWVEAENLGDQVWFIGYESFFSLSVKELSGLKNNSIYLLKQNLDCDYEDERHSETGVRVFEMAKRRRKRRMRKVPSFPGPALMFWPSHVPATLSCPK